MKLSVGFNFDYRLLEALSKIQEVKEIYGKMAGDYIGGGRSNYTLKNVSFKEFQAFVKKAHEFGIQFNYLLNAASLYGIEQTRVGQRRIRTTLDRLCEAGVDTLTVASPYLLRIIKNQYPQFKVKIGAFAVIDNALKAQYWENMGADALCISAIACNRNFAQLQAIRTAVSCECILIVNAFCLQSCPFELTHMHILSGSSRKNDPLNGFCFDYCFLHCSYKKLLEPVNYMKSVWIRPEDIHLYEEIGYSTFKLVERSSPTNLIIKRVTAYANRSFSGNLLEIAGPVASIKKELGVLFLNRLQMMLTLLRPLKIKISSLLLFKKYAEQIILHNYSRASAGVYIDNQLLDGFIEGLRERNCSFSECKKCGYCESFVNKAIRFNQNYRTTVLEIARKLDQGLLSGSHWK